MRFGLIILVKKYNLGITFSNSDVFLFRQALITTL